MKNSKLAPIVIFVYARPDHTKMTIEALSKNKFAKDTDVYIFSDAAKNEKTKSKVDETRKYIKSIAGNKYFKSTTIIEAEKNKGLANSIISGVTKIIEKYGKVIVLEDDLLTSDNFIEYMNNALNFYKDDNKIWSISGYNVPMKVKNYPYDVYLNYRGCSWGWATWKNRWDKVDWNVSDYKNFKNNLFKRIKFNRGGNDMSQMLDSQMHGMCDSWAIRWCYQEYKENMYTIYPIKTLINNIGLDGTGTHSGFAKGFDSKLTNDEIKLVKNLIINKKIMREFKSKFSYGIKQIIKEILTVIGIYEYIYSLRGKK